MRNRVEDIISTLDNVDLKKAENLAAMIALANLGHRPPASLRLDAYRNYFRDKLAAAAQGLDPAVGDADFGDENYRKKLCTHAAFLCFQFYLNSADESKTTALKTIADCSEDEDIDQISQNLNTQKPNFLPAGQGLNTLNLSDLQIHKLRRVAAKKLVELFISKLELADLSRLKKAKNDPVSFRTLLNDPEIDPAANNNNPEPFKVLKLDPDREEVLDNKDVQALLSSAVTRWDKLFRMSRWERAKEEAPKDPAGQPQKSEVEAAFNTGAISRKEFEDGLLHNLVSQSLGGSPSAQELSDAITSAKTHLESQRFLSGEYTVKLPNKTELHEKAEAGNKVSTKISSSAEGLNDAQMRKHLFKLLATNLFRRLEIQGRDPATESLEILDLPTYRSKNGQVETWDNSPQLQADVNEALTNAGFDLAKLQLPAQAHLRTALHDDDVELGVPVPPAPTTPVSSRAPGMHLPSESEDESEDPENSGVEMRLLDNPFRPQ